MGKIIIVKIVIISAILLCFMIGLYSIIKSLLINKYENIGWQMYTKGEYVEAIGYYNKIIKIDPKNFKAYHYAGFVGSVSKNYKYTVSMLDKALEINPNSDDYYIRGDAKFNLKEYSAAIEDFDKCIDLYDQNTLAYLYRGLSKILMDNNDGLKDLELSFTNIKGSNLEFMLTNEDKYLQEKQKELFATLDFIKTNKPEQSKDIEKYIKCLADISNNNK